MKNPAIYVLLALAALLFAVPTALHSQQPQAASTAQILARMQKENAQLIERQQKLLERLDVMERTASDIRIFARRS